MGKVRTIGTIIKDLEYKIGIYKAQKLKHPDQLGYEEGFFNIDERIDDLQAIVKFLKENNMLRERLAEYCPPPKEEKDFENPWTHHCTWCYYRHACCNFEPNGIEDPACKQFKMGDCYKCAIYKSNGNKHSNDNNICQSYDFEGCDNFKE